jgi:hypothetical protein
MYSEPIDVHAEAAGVAADHPVATAAVVADIPVAMQSVRVHGGTELVVDMYDTELEADHARALGLPESIRRALRHRRSVFRPGGERGDPSACVKLVFTDNDGVNNALTNTAVWAPFAAAAGGMLTEVEFNGVDGGVMVYLGGN